MKIQSFTDLIVWKEGHKLVLATYLLTQDLPKNEIFGLTSQMRRAVTSFTSNIAEGFGRNSIKDKSRFYNIARGSLIELQNQLIISKDLNYLQSEQFDKIFQQTITCHKLINAFITSTNNRLTP